MIPHVDIVVLTRHNGPLHPEVERGFREQSDVELIVHRIVGAARSEDRCRWEIIARARNEGKFCGSAPWLMFLDDDVVLDRHCVSTLVEELGRRPAYAALAADYLGESRDGTIASHVSMGATLFRRHVLEQLQFTWRDTKCECQCCCDDLRRLHWGIDYCSAALAQHLSKAETDNSPTPTEFSGENSLVSCLCVTHHRVRLLRRSVRCFLSQSYANRELIVVYQSDDESTRQFLANLGESSIRPVEVPAVPRLSLGTLRNVARQAAAGKYVATWDDDDWHGPHRLAEQVRAMQDTGKGACLLARLCLYDCETKRGYVSFIRPWEQSMIAEKAILPTFPDMSKGEDTPVVKELIRLGQVILLDQPELYLYTYHGLNTWDRYHWKRILRHSRPLGVEPSGAVTALLNGETHGVIQFQTHLAGSIHAGQKSIGSPAESQPSPV